VFLKSKPQVTDEHGKLTKGLCRSFSIWIHHLLHLTKPRCPNFKPTCIQSVFLRSPFIRSLHNIRLTRLKLSDTSKCTGRCQFWESFLFPSSVRNKVKKSLKSNQVPIFFQKVWVCFATRPAGTDESKNLLNCVGDNLLHGQWKSDERCTSQIQTTLKLFF